MYLVSPVTTLMILLYVMIDRKDLIHELKDFGELKVILDEIRK